MRYTNREEGSPQLSAAGQRDVGCKEHEAANRSADQTSSRTKNCGDIAFQICFHSLRRHVQARVGLDVKPDRRAGDAKGLTSPFQPRKEEINEFFQVLPEGKERNYADRDQQLH